MDLYLVQHAKAKSEEEDPLRPLSAQGYRDITKTAKFLSNLHHNINRIYHSGKLRAKQTAEVLAEVLKISNLAEMKGLNPLDEPEIVADEIAKEQSSIVIVGHLPHLGKLASLLLCGDKNMKIVSFQMAGIVCLHKEERIWSVKWAVIPEILSDI